jgi:chromosome segregation ATPase
MGKYFDNDYNEVEAFSKEELDTKLSDAKAAWEKEVGSSSEETKTKLTELETRLAEVTESYEKVSKLNEDKKKSIADLKEALNKKDENIGDVTSEKTKAYEKMRDDRLNKLVGEDKEYGEALKEQFERIGKETLDVDELDKYIKEAHVLTLHALDREITPFNPSDVSGEAPAGKPQENVEHKQTVDALTEYATNLMGIKKSE